MKIYRLLQAFFDHAVEKDFAWLAPTWIVMLFLGGAILWGQFFNWGNIPLDFHDWAEITAPRLAVVRDAMIKGVLPLHAGGTYGLRGITDRYLSIPDVLFTPQLILLRFLEVGPFILANQWIMFAIGTWGLLRIRRRFSISLAIFTIIFLLFNFNGHLLAHQAVGHENYVGYFLYPWFVLLLFDMLDGDHSWAWVAKISLVQLGFYLQGSYHHWVWNLLWLGMAGVISYRHFFAVLKSSVFSVLLSMVRILPSALLYEGLSKDFYGGYPVLHDLFTSMVSKKLPQDSLPFMNFYSNLGYWEFDLYIGYLGLLFLVAGLGLWCWGRLRRRDWSTSTLGKAFLPVALPCLVFIVFAINKNFSFIKDLPIPLLNGERVTSRMVILPLVMGIIMAGITLNQWLVEKRRPWSWIIGLPVVAWLAVDLTHNTLYWQVTQVFPVFPLTPVDVTTKLVANHADPSYIGMLVAGFTVSILACVYLWVRIRSEQRELRESQKDKS